MGAVTRIFPVAMVQVGCAATETVGLNGTDGAAFIVTILEADKQPVVLSLTVTL